MKLNSDGTLSLPAMTLTAQQLDELLQELAKARARMQPPVAESFDKPSPDDRATTMASPAMRMFRTAGGEISLCVRHRGFGWLVFMFEQSEARELAAWLLSAAGPENLLSEKLTGGDLH